MASEASITVGLQIRKGNLNYGENTSFQADVLVAQGPTPGLVVATTAGVQASLALLTNPGLCWLANLSSDYRVEVGIKDTSSGLFEPLLELLPGESYVIRLARNIGSELTGGVGTGTAGSGGVLWLKSIGGTANCRVEAFGGF